MVKKYEQLSFQLDRSKDSFQGKNPLCSSEDFKQASASKEPVDVRRGYEDGTSRFVRDLRERQAMAADTQAIHGIGQTRQVERGTGAAGQ